MAKKKAVKKVVKPMAKGGIIPKAEIGMAGFDNGKDEAVIPMPPLDLSKTQTKTVNTGGGTVTIDMSSYDETPDCSHCNGTGKTRPWVGLKPIPRVFCPDCKAFDNKTSKCCLNPHPQPTMGADDWCMAGLLRR